MIKLNAVGKSIVHESDKGIFEIAQCADEKYALLFAASPDLLDACEIVVGLLGDSKFEWNLNIVIQQLLTEINKSQGQ